MTIEFDAKILRIGSKDIIRIPVELSKEFSSRGMVMVKGVINDVEFKKPLEPDGRGSHWLEIDSALGKQIGAGNVENVSVRMEQTDEWVEPDIPDDIMNAIITESLLSQWNSLTTRSRWEWIRWIRSTKNIQTRNKRIFVACSKLSEGDRNPCCFDSTRCTVPEVSMSGMLLE